MTEDKTGHAPGWCIHYQYREANGVTDAKACKAGIVYYEKWRGTTFDQRPCFLTRHGNPKPNTIPCSQLRVPTREEMRLHEIYIRKRLLILRTVMIAIKPWKDKHKNTDFSETIECPVCAGRLHLSIAHYNNHVHGKCETLDCVSWVQ